MNIIITGGRGFIGSNLTKKAIEKGHKVGILDAGLIGANALLSVISPSQMDVECVNQFCNINNPETVSKSIDEIELIIGKTDCIIHLAAETHVDRSISNSKPFVETNVGGTMNMLEETMKRGISKFVHMSTDEVYGALQGDSKSSKETDAFRPSSPYSASKAGGELLAMSYFVTHKLPVLVVRSSNNFGPLQYHEKLVPLMIKNALADIQLPVYGEGKNIRDWLYVEDCANALLLIAEKGKIGEAYNIGSGGNNEKENIHVVKTLLSLLKKPESLIKFVEDRKGHDFRYSVCIDKIKEELGWSPAVSFEAGLEKTVNYYLTRYNEDVEKKKLSERFKRKAVS